MSFGYGKHATLDDVTLEVPGGALFALLGASGSGKTTLLKLVGGYLRPGRGRICLVGRDITPLPPERRNVGTVFQSYALFPHLTARGNVAFGLEVRGVPREERERRVEEALDRVALPAAERGRKPAALSGGQQQRVALARALVVEPDLLLLDEPLSNLDRGLREQLREELRQVQRRTGVTTLLVTHDRDEALALADVVGVLAAGRLLQAGPPREVHERPCCPYVARLLGDVNLLTAGEVAALRRDKLPACPTTYLLRPRDVRLSADGPLAAVVADVSFRGDQTLVTLRVGPTRLHALDPSSTVRPGDAVRVAITPDAIYPLPHADPPDLPA